MKKATWLVILALIFAAGCAATGPRNQSEMFPAFNQDPSKGLIVIEGSASADISFYDEAGRLIQQWGEAGASPFLTYNGRTKVRLYAYQLPVGNYAVEARPFYYYSYFLPGKRALVELPKQNYWVVVDRNPSDYYDYDYTKRHWGWILRIYSGDIPQEHFQAPVIDIKGTGIIRDALEWIRAR